MFDRIAKSKLANHSAPLILCALKNIILEQNKQTKKYSRITLLKLLVSSKLSSITTDTEITANSIMIRLPKWNERIQCCYRLRTNFSLDGLRVAIRLYLVRLKLASEIGGAPVLRSKFTSPAGCEAYFIPLA